MHSIITFAYDVINVCVKCRHRQDCEWFQGAGEVVLENVTPDEYCELTQEQIAARIHADVPAPEDSCRQRSFDDMMAYLDEHLPTAEMPNTSDELLNIHYQISQLKRRLVRIPEDCREVFDAPIRAIIDRCLAAIDYHCLMCHLDVIDVLKDSYKSYDRMKILRRDRVESVINILLSQAHKLTAPGRCRHLGYLRNFLAKGDCAAGVVSIVIPRYVERWGFELEQYQVYARFVLLDSVTGYRSQYHEYSALLAAL